MGVYFNVMLDKTEEGRYNRNMENLHEITLIPERFTLARKKARYTRVAAARALGVHNQRLYDYEKGLSRPYGDTMAKMCYLYDVPMEFFLSSKET